MRTARASLGILALQALGFLQPLNAQDAEHRLVIPVTVLDRQGDPVDSLTAANFKIDDLGQPVSVLSATLESRPRRVAVLVDTSASMYETAAVSWSAASELTAALTPYSKVTVFTLGARLDQIAPLSNDADMLAAALKDARRLAFEGYSPLYDAVADVSRECGARWDVGDAVAVITDGIDTASRRPIADPSSTVGLTARVERWAADSAVTAMASVGVRVCVLRVSTRHPRPGTWADLAEYWIRGVTEATGGFSVKADDIHAVRAMAASLTQAYRLEVSVPRVISKAHGWRLTAVDNGRKLDVKLTYPHLVGPSGTH